ncbi:MAG: tripartite tricarboxylate transporter substrate binding protein [Betaproteobacteria bacterium]|nr:tripartite tricarboxylate transporter substrate binding protein [Betaproteobacteria bacterium]
MAGICTVLAPLLLTALLLTVLWPLEPAVASDTFPSKPIRIIVPFPPGGSADPIARLVGQQMSETFGQPVIIENRPGGGTRIGTEYVARSAPDGYTLFLAATSHAVNPSLYAKVNYDPLRDFMAVSLASSFPFILLIHPSVPARNLREFIALAKASPGKLDYASGGNGSASHLAAEMFKSMTGTDLLHVPYKGGAPALIDAIGGQVAATFGSIQQSLPQVRSGKLRALGVTGRKRSSLAPDLPTLAESGLPGYEVTPWNAVLAPARTPPQVIATLNAEITRILRLPANRDLMAAQGVDLLPTTPKEAQDYIANEVTRWAKLIQQAGIKVE